MQDYIVWFDQLGMNDVEQVGGKNASLGEMISHLSSAGVRVPGGFATTSKAYWEFLSTNKLNEKINLKYAAIVDACIMRIQSERALESFNSNLFPKYGMFYNGWSNLVHTKYIDSRLFRLSSIQNKIKDASSAIVRRLSESQRDSVTILPSYADACWPADNLIGMCSVGNDTLRAQWIDVIKNASKHTSGLIHHTGSNVSEIRGSSSAMITYCLNEIGYEKIDQYNSIYKKVFVDNYLGIQLVKENENGSNEMDVDSGPIVFGYGASATIMNIKAQASFNNPEAKLTWGAMNTIAVPINLFGKKYYLLKQEPMLDLFMLWGSTEL